jgi:mRNA-degrading endonuclease RelE of RelBE toxin-antitoxin system
LAFKVLLHPSAAKALKKLPEPENTKMKLALEEVSIDPYKAGKPLHPSYYWSTRRGDYRAIYTINRDQNQVIVLFVGHRKKVYDNFTKLT